MGILVPKGLCHGCLKKVSGRGKWCDACRPQAKHKNRKVVVDGLTFDSAKEARRWRMLATLESDGEIRLLQRQVPIIAEINGISVFRFVADFTYRNEIGIVVEDVKSEHTRRLPVYRLKKKILKALLGLDILET